MTKKSSQKTAKEKIKEQETLRLSKIIEILEDNFPEAQTALLHKNSFELLIATILSAQCTDEQVNKVTPKLFSEAPTPAQLAKLPLPRIEKLIGSVNYFRSKAKNIQTTANLLCSRFNGEVPQSLDELITLAGVGRKTANVVLGNAFNIPSLVVDTHVKRIAKRLGFTRATNPETVESDLMLITPRAKWVVLSHLFILHGRKTCRAQNPTCLNCPISKLCPSREVKTL